MGVDPSLKEIRHFFLEHHLVSSIMLDNIGQLDIGLSEMGQKTAVEFSRDISQHRRNSMRMSWTWNAALLSKEGAKHIRRDFGGRFDRRSTVVDASFWLIIYCS